MAIWNRRRKPGDVGGPGGSGEPGKPGAAREPGGLGVDPEGLRRRLRALRRESGLTQEALAERAGLDPRYVQSLESGERDNPSLHTLNALARGLNCPLITILFDPDEVFAWLRLEVLRPRREGDIGEG